MRNGRPVIWTPERDEMIKRDFPEGVHAEVMKHRLDELPGPPVRADQIAGRAWKLGLRRPEWFRVARAMMGVKKKAEVRHQRSHLWEKPGRKPKAPAVTGAIPSLAWDPIPPPPPSDRAPPPVPYGGVTIVSRAQKEGRTFSMMGGRSR
jgi:hypothetical protein